MAIARPSALIGALSGQLGTSVFANTNQGLIIKHRPNRTNQKTTAQLAQRARVQRCKLLFRDLTAAEYLEWRILAEQQRKTNRLGITSKLSPFSLFMMQNMNLLLVPSSMTRTPIPISPASALLADNIVFTAGGTYSFNLTTTDGYSSGRAFLYGSRPMRTTPNRTPYSWSYLGSIFFFGTDPEDISTEWDAVLGPPAAGEFVHVKVRSNPDASRKNPDLIFTTTFV